MMTAALIGFIASLVGLVILFSLKYIEMRQGVVIAPRMRMRADEYARDAKVWIYRAIDRVEQLPSDMVVLFRFSVHIGAIVFARIAGAAEAGAHRLADRVSHKHQFERNESQSQFLKTISEHKSTLAPAPHPIPEPVIVVEPAPIVEPVIKQKTGRKKRAPKPAPSALEINQ